MPKKSTTAAKLDDIDLRILNALSEQGRISNTSLSKEVGLSESATLERVRRLEKSGVILGYAARVVPEALGLGAMAIAHLKLSDAENHQQVTKQLVSSKHVISCDRVLGPFDLAVKIGASNLEELESVIHHELRQSNEFDVVESMFVTCTLKD